MPYEEIKATHEESHSLSIDRRSRLSASGVGEVESFNETEVIMTAAGWRMSVRGEGLNVERLSVDSGDVVITGRINAVEYEDAPPAREGFWRRLLG